MVRLWGMLTVAMMAFARGVAADACGGVYTVKRGDSLSFIANDLYKNARLWTAIYANNISAIGDNPDTIEAGQELALTCVNGLPTGLPGAKRLVSVDPSAPPEEETVVARAETGLLDVPALPRIKLVTGDDFAPFAHRGALNDGLMTEVVTAAMTAAVGQDGFETFWINDRAAHLETILPSHLMEMAFPWEGADCSAAGTESRCADYHFSNPMFEYLVLLYTRADQPIPFAEDSDIEGRTLCRPDGYTTQLLNKSGRNWVKDGKITLVQPRTVATCFSLLQGGSVDAVVLNEFTAQHTLGALGLDDAIIAVPGRPIDITGLHVLVHKSHPQAEALLAAVNDGLRTIRETGQYADIVGRHLAQIWARE